MNSGSVFFEPKSWFEAPQVYREKRKEVNKKQRELVEVNMKNRVRVDENEYNVIKLEFSNIVKNREKVK